MLNGRKRWIGNATFADIIVIWARSSETNQVRLHSSTSWSETADPHRGHAWHSHIRAQGLYSMEKHFPASEKQSPVCVASWKAENELLKSVRRLQVNAFIVRKGSQGLRTSKIENKIALRCVQNADIFLDDCFVPDSARLPGVSSFKVRTRLRIGSTQDAPKGTLGCSCVLCCHASRGCNHAAAEGADPGMQDTNKVLAISRIMVAWQPVGICCGVFDMCTRYVGEREQFGTPLGSFQLVQEKLARMLGNIQAMFLMCWRLSKLYEEVRSSLLMPHCMPCLCAHAMMTGLVRMPGDMELSYLLLRRLSRWYPMECCAACHQAADIILFMLWS